MTSVATMTGPHVESSWRPRALRLLACLAASFAPGVIGSRFEPGAWYQTIEKSALTPPGWVFPVVWPVLYLMMGVALWRFLEAAPRRDRSIGAALFAVQLVLNGLWSYLFFGLQRPGLALVEILLLWASIAAVITVFHRHSRLSAGLLVPYLAWVSFAAFLNFEVWRLQ
jgi:benzodiazapine receptor